jgi:hypothetical protein
MPARRVVIVILEVRETNTFAHESPTVLAEPLS